MDDEKKSVNEQQKKKDGAVKQSIDAIEEILQQFSACSRHDRGDTNEHRTPYGKKWKKNDILCCLVNIDKKYVEFFLNNKSMGIAFKDIKFDGNIYISLTLEAGVHCIVLKNQTIDVTDASKWDIGGNMDINHNTKRIEMLKTITYDDNVKIDELKEGDKVTLIHDNEIIQSEIQRINSKTRKMLIRIDGWKWISMDSDQLFPSKDVVNRIFDEMNRNTTKLGIKFEAKDGFPTVTLQIPLNLSCIMGEFKYEILICTKEMMQVGFSDDSFKSNEIKGNGCGDDDHSWAFDGNRVLKWGKKSEDDKKRYTDTIIPKDFIYEYKKDYTHAITRALYAAHFKPNAALKWFAKHWKDENIYLPITDKELQEISARHKEEGNKFYKMKKYYDAICEYDNAIWYGTLCANSKELHIYYSNRSIALSKIHEYELALLDAKNCILLNQTWSKGYLRKGHALMKLYKFDESIEAYRDGIKLCDKSHHKLLKVGLNTAIKYKEIMMAKEKQREKIKFIVSPAPTEESMRKDIEEGIKKVDAIHIGNKMYTFKDLITFDTFGWKLENDNDNEDEKKICDDCKVWKCDNYPAILTVQYYKKECDIKKKPTDKNMFSIRHIQRDNLLKSGINSGIILSENFKVCEQPLIYGVEVLIKTIIVPNRASSGYIYWIKIPFKNEYFELKLETTYKGQTTGNRDSVMVVRLSNALKINPIAMMNQNIWNEDPYDSLYSQGALMNLSERKEYDVLFPYHPLSILRSKLMTQFKNSVTINSQKANKMDML